MSATPRIALLTYGSRGDVAPFLALASGLRQRGAAVEVVGPGPYAGLADRHRIPYRALPGDPDQLARDFADRAGLNFPLQVLRMSQHVEPIAAEVLKIVLEVGRQADLLVHSFLMTEAGHLAAHRNRIPDVSAQLFPVFAPTGEFAAVAHASLPLGPTYRRLTHSLNTFVFRFGGRMMYARLRARHPELPRLELWPFEAADLPATPLLFGYSPIVLPRPSDWPPWAKVTGYWDLPPPPGWSPPGPLVRFLEDGPPPVYFGLGSMRPARYLEAIEATAEACARLGARAVISSPPEVAQGDGLPGSIHFTGEVPHDWLFPRMRAVIHHGGAGTTGSALRSGVPSMAVPVSADQAFWARRIHALGVGPGPIPLTRWTTGRAARSLDRLLNNPFHWDTARSLSERLAAERGVEIAVELILARLEGTAA